jgi:hypothetical protein
VPVCVRVRGNVFIGVPRPGLGVAGPVSFRDQAQIGIEGINFRLAVAIGDACLVITIARVCVGEVGN